MYEHRITRTRPSLELLEARHLLNAGSMDAIFGNNGETTVSFPEGGQLHALTTIGQDLRLVGSDARGLLRWQPQRHGRVQPRLQLADAEERTVEKVLIGGPAAVAADGAAIN